MTIEEAKQMATQGDKLYLTNEGILELVDEELRHYQKKMLGGYKYV